MNRILFRRVAALSIGVILFCGLLSSCSLHGIKSGIKRQDLAEEMRFANTAMGGIVHLKMAGAKKEVALAAADAAFATMDRLAADLDHRSSEGSIARVNGAAGREAVVVSADAFALIERALDFGRMSAGVFDISIGAITTTPFYYRQNSTIDKRLVDYGKVVIDKHKHTVFLPEQGMALDLGGLAKGTIIDAAADTIRQRGVPAALVEASGDSFCYGERFWKVGLQDPRSDSLLGVIEVKNAAVCGSGDYYQYDESSVEEGKRNHHILDATKLTSAHKSIAVTAIAPNAELADALATTLFIMGPVKGLAFLENLPGCSALWVLPDRQLVVSPAFPSFIKPAAK